MPKAPFGERLAVLETEMRDHRDSVALFRDAVQGFTKAVEALTETLKADPPNGSARTWKSDLALIGGGAALAGGGVTGLMKLLG
jgi:hypothetical protein